MEYLRGAQAINVWVPVPLHLSGAVVIVVAYPFASSDLAEQLNPLTTVYCRGCSRFSLNEFTIKRCGSYPRCYRTAWFVDYVSELRPPTGLSFILQVM
jgi:hypothetical protein